MIVGERTYGNVLVYAARYTYNRQTGAALQVVSAIESAWEQKKNLTNQKTVSKL